MRSKLLSLTTAVALAAAFACSRGNGTTDTKPLGSTVTVTGCLTGSEGAVTLVPGARAGAVGTTGGSQQRYRLIDEANTGVQRYIGREATVTGKLERPREEGAAAGSTDAASEAASRLPTLRVTSMTSGGECNAAR